MSETPCLVYDPREDEARSYPCFTKAERYARRVVAQGRGYREIYTLAGAKRSYKIAGDYLAGVTRDGAERVWTDLTPAGVDVLAREATP